MRLIATIALFFALTAPAAAAKRQVPKGWLGVVVDGPLIESSFTGGGAEWDRMASSGVENVRTAIYWSAIQPSGPADASFAGTDAVILDAARRRLGVLPVLQGTPGWAALNPGDPASPPRDPADFARFLPLLVARYGPNGSLWREHPEVPKTPIRQWQVWNEPNLTRYWNVAPWAPSYVKLLKAADKALKAADPRSKTVLAGLPNESWEAIDQIYDEGARGSFDVVTAAPVHRQDRERDQDREDRPAPHGRAQGRQDADLGHRALVARGQGQDQAGGRVVLDHRAGQAQRLEEGLGLLAAQRVKLGIQRVYWYTWLSVEGLTTSAFDYSGLRRVSAGALRDAPALATFKRVAKRLEGCAKRPGTRRSAARGPYACGRRGGTGGLRRGLCGAARPPLASRIPVRAGGVLDVAARVPALRDRRDRLERHRGRDGRGVLLDERAGAGARADRGPPRRGRARALRAARARPGSALVAGGDARMHPRWCWSR